MCEAAAYMLKNDEEELILDEVAKIIPVGDKLSLVTIMGEKKVMDASIKEINLIRHKIILIPRTE